jgi:hypothetical protein
MVSVEKENQFEGAHDFWITFVVGVRRGEHHVQKVRRVSILWLWNYRINIKANLRILRKKAACKKSFSILMVRAGKVSHEEGI